MKLVLSKNYFNLAKNIYSEAIQNGSESNSVLEIWTEVCYQNFGGWEVQIMRNLRKNFLGIIMSHHQCGYPWSSLATPPYHPLLPAGLQGYILGTELPYVRSSWSSCLCLSMWSGPQEYIPYELISTSSTVSRMSGSSNFDSLHDGWLVAIHLLLCKVLPSGLIQYC